MKQIFRKQKIEILLPVRGKNLCTSSGILGYVTYNCEASFKFFSPGIPTNALSKYVHQTVI